VHHAPAIGHVILLPPDYRASRAARAAAVAVSREDSDLIALDRIKIVSNILRPYNP